MSAVGAGALLVVGFVQWVGAPVSASESEDPIAEALSDAVASGTDVVVDELTTQTQLVTATADGRLKATLSAEPVRVEDGPGDAWVAVDTSLVEGTDGTLTPLHAASEMAFSGGGDEAPQVLGRSYTGSGSRLRAA